MIVDEDVLERVLSEPMPVDKVMALRFTTPEGLSKVEQDARAARVHKVEVAISKPYGFQGYLIVSVNARGHMRYHVRFGIPPAPAG